MFKVVTRLTLILLAASDLQKDFTLKQLLHVNDGRLKMLGTDLYQICFNLPAFRRTSPKEEGSSHFYVHSCSVVVVFVFNCSLVCLKCFVCSGLFCLLGLGRTLVIFFFSVGYFLRYCKKKNLGFLECTTWYVERATLLRSCLAF